MAHPLFGPEVRMMLQDDNVVGLKAFVETLHPRTVAETLAEDSFTVEQVWHVLRQADARPAALAFEYFPIERQVRMAEGSGRPAMAKLIELMSHDDRVALLRRLSPQAAEALLRLVDEADRRDIATLFRYAASTVGAIMTTDYAWLPAGLTAGQAIDRLRQQAPDRETIYYIFILDEGSRRLLGVLSLRALVLADRGTPVRDIMEHTDLVTLKAGDDRETAARALAKYDLIAIPVLDDEGRLVGIVTHDDVIDVITEEATEDLQKQGAVGPFSGNYLDQGLLRIWKKRALWLSVLFFAELLTYTVMEQFEDALRAVLILSLFVPLCLSTGGNSGSQAASLITRELALGHIRARDWLRVLRHEIIMGLLLGLTLGGIGLLRGAWTSDDLRSDKRVLDAPIDAIAADSRPLERDSAGRYVLPEGMPLATREPVRRQTTVALPPDAAINATAIEEGMRYTFPAGSVTRTETVGRWRFAAVIAQAVAFICLWGTLIGAMLPLFFQRIGADPAVASTPFVATFVDVTGILAYFLIASAYLL